MAQKTLQQSVGERPFQDYARWWRMGPTFLSFMAEAIVSPWTELRQDSGDIETVRSYVAEYLGVVYGREARAALVDQFINRSFSEPIQSGEFDALSYAFFRSAFELIQGHTNGDEQSLARERRRFTRRVGQIFFGLLHRHLALALPDSLDDEAGFTRLKDCLQVVGRFLQTEGYLRDYFDFQFTVHVKHKGREIVQTEAEFVTQLKRHGVAYALYIMGYPVILPSAVYLYQTSGEAQHHSSRTIEELFELIGYQARETDDFDPSGYPSDRVVELWEIKKLII